MAGTDRGPGGAGPLSVEFGGGRCKDRTCGICRVKAVLCHLLPAERGDLLVKLERPHEARLEFERAAALTPHARERALLLERAHSSG